ncbi:hypothetical protein J7F03_36950 [Streptomyces sp. ISL-43]|uniref:hypothetical protein n=1 Tax=Streptomyces sp. ISL-43 TaxID=2819183 RepID=UPI001BE852F6|nr:hypothetical protein [Streptomyces sp. ISL-43]MBT2452545.1 hypothetical protein [Streptomyces sp. ISL-43]
MNEQHGYNSVSENTIHGPVQLTGNQINTFIGCASDPSPHDLLNNHKRIARATYWQMKREFLLWLWKVFFVLEFTGTAATVLVIRKITLAGYLLQGHLLWVASVAVLGWFGDAIFFWVRRRLEARDNPLLTRGEPVFLQDVLPRIMVLFFGVFLYFALPRILL